MKILIFTVLSTAFTLWAYVPYIRLVIADGTVKPNRASWFVWWVIDASMAWVLFSAHAWSAFLMFAAFTLGTTIVLSLSLKQGEGQFSKSDMFYIALAIGGIILWRASDNENISVIANMVAAIAGTIPTIKKSFLDPDSEDAPTWRYFWIGGLFNVLAISSWTFVDAAPTLIVWVAQWGINVALVLGRARQVRMKKVALS